MYNSNDGLCLMCISADNIASMFISWEYELAYTLREETRDIPAVRLGSCRPTWRLRMLSIVDENNSTVVFDSYNVKLLTAFNPYLTG